MSRCAGRIPSLWYVPISEQLDCQAQTGLIPFKADICSLHGQPPRRDTHTNQLGTQTIKGTLAYGRRTTQTIPAGEEGNEQPLVIVSEIWYSRELGLTLQSITDDPRTGKKTEEVEELSLSEPDPSLFALPEGYAVKDIPPQP